MMYSSPLKRFKDVFIVPPESPLSNIRTGRLTPIKTSETKLAPGNDRNKSESDQDASLSKRLPIILEYLSKTRIEEDFNELCLELLSKDVLPYNPYPWLVDRMTSRNERWLLSEKSAIPFQQMMSDRKGFEVASRLSGAVVRPVSCDFIWGLRSLVAMANGVEIWRYLWLLKDITPNPERHRIPKDYTCQVIPAIVGPTVFFRTLYKYVYSTEFKFEFIVVGRDIDKAIDIFLREILNDIQKVEAHNLHVLLRVYVPVLENRVWVNKMWIYTDVVNREEEMLRLLGNAVSNRQLLTAECLFSLDKDGSTYIHGQKQYALTVIKISDRVKEEDKIIHFTELPFVTLYEGIFTQQSHVESYITVCRHDFIEEESPVEVENGEAGVDATPGGNGLDPAAAAAGDGAERGASLLRQHPPPHPPSPHPLPHRMNSNGGRQNNTKVLVDGFQAVPDEYDVDCNEVKNTIRSSWQKRVSGLDLETEPWLIIHNVLLLELLDCSSSSPSELLDELTRATHSRAARLYSLMHLNRSLRELIYKFEPVNLENVPMAMMLSMFTAYKNAMLEFFDGKEQAENSILISYRSNILRRLGTLTKWADTGRALTMETLKLIKDIHSYMFTLYLTLVKNILDLCPLLKKFVQSLKSQFSSEPASGGLPAADNTLQVVSAALEGVTGSVVELFSHGLEEEKLMKHNEQVIDVEFCIRQSYVHSSVEEAKQIVLMKYVVDTHLDEIWAEFFMSIASSPDFPENPCNQLISLFRRCSTRVDLCFENSQTTLSRIKSSLSITATDINRYVHHIRHFNVYGLPSVLSILDPDALQPALHSISPLCQKNFRFQEGPHKVAICTAVSGNTTLYGRLDPYLPLIQLHEYCFIQGPKGCATEALQLYIRITFEDVLSKYKSNDYIVDGISFSGKLWSLDEIIYKKKGFALQMEQSMHSREPVVLKLFVPEDWRLVPVTKQLLFRYVVEDQTEIRPFYVEKHYTFYQNIFLEADRAAFHLQFAGPPDGADPFHSRNLKSAIHDIDEDIRAHVERCDWLEVCRLIFWRAQLMTKSSAIFVEVWRALHSVARRLDYIITLGQSLQDLIRNAIMADEHQYLIETGERKLKKMTRQPRRIDSWQQDLIMSRMLKAFRQKLRDICREDICMAPRGIVTMITTKIKSLVEKDEESGQDLVFNDLQSLIIMDEILLMVSTLRDSLSYDVLQTSAAIKEVLDSINSR